MATPVANDDGRRTHDDTGIPCLLQSNPIVERQQPDISQWKADHGSTLRYLRKSHFSNPTCDDGPMKINSGGFHRHLLLGYTLSKIETGKNEFGSRLGLHMGHLRGGPDESPCRSSCRQPPATHRRINFVGPARCSRISLRAINSSDACKAHEGLAPLHICLQSLRVRPRPAMTRRSLIPMLKIVSSSRANSSGSNFSFISGERQATCACLSPNQTLRRR
jgi:hypothetical protein